MLYSTSVVIPSNGTLKVAMFGGETEDKHNSRKAVGYDAPHVFGVVSFKASVPENMLLCRAEVRGYGDTLVDDVALPNNVFTEFPCTIVITGPPGTQIMLEAWHTLSTGADRGAKRSQFKLAASPNAIYPVPIWAQSFDLTCGAGLANIEFATDIAFANIVGEANGAQFVGYSIPDSAQFARVTCADTSTLVFRQR